MQRRGFLKFLGVVAVTAPLPALAHDGAVWRNGVEFIEWQVCNNVRRGGKMVGVLARDAKSGRLARGVVECTDEVWETPEGRALVQAELRKYVAEWFENTIEVA